MAKGLIEEIRERYPDVDWPTAYTEPVWRGRRGRDLIDGRKAIIVKQGEEETIAYIATDEYKIAPFENVVFHVEKAMGVL